MNRAEIYLKAAEVVRTNGHYKGAYWGRPESEVGIDLTAAESPVCAVGALSVATIGHPTPVADDVDAMLVDFASRMFGPVNEAAAVVRIASWNDAAERTPADVIAAFEQAAREAA